MPHPQTATAAKSHINAIFASSSCLALAVAVLAGASRAPTAARDPSLHLSAEITDMQAAVGDWELYDAGDECLVLWLGEAGERSLQSRARRFKVLVACRLPSMMAGTGESPNSSQRLCNYHRIHGTTAEYILVADQSVVGSEGMPRGAERGRHCQCCKQQ